MEVRCRWLWHSSSSSLKLEIWSTGRFKRGEVRGSVNRPDVTGVVGQLLAGGKQARDWKLSWANGVGRSGSWNWNRNYWPTLAGGWLLAVVSQLPMILVSGDVHHALLALPSDHSFLWQGQRVLELQAGCATFPHAHTLLPPTNSKDRPTHINLAPLISSQSPHQQHTHIYTHILDTELPF